MTELRLTLHGTKALPVTVRDDHWQSSEEGQNQEFSKRVLRRT